MKAGGWRAHHQRHDPRWEGARRELAAHLARTCGSRTLDEFYTGMGRNVPVGRVGEAAEAGDVICFLASARASYLTGTAINIDGGSSPVL